MDNLEYIDNYYQTEHNPEQTRLFEQKILEDENFAADVAFYLSTMQAAKDESITDKIARFRTLYEQQTTRPVVKIRRMWPQLSAAAAVIVIIIGIYTFSHSAGPQQLADRYINQELQNLEVTMGKETPMQTGATLYNEKKYREALTQFDHIIRTDTANSSALENAGKAAIQLGEYDKALEYFKQLANKSHLYVNPALLYEALTLMKRNLPGDNDQAKKILQEIVRQNLDEKETAQKWLNEW